MVGTLLTTPLSAIFNAVLMSSEFEDFDLHNGEGSLSGASRIHHVSSQHTGVTRRSRRLSGCGCSHSDITQQAQDLRSVLRLPSCAHNVLHHLTRITGLGGSGEVIICIAHTCSQIYCASLMGTVQQSCRMITCAVIRGRLLQQLRDQAERADRPSIKCTERKLDQGASFMPAVLTFVDQQRDNVLTVVFAHRLRAHITDQGHLDTQVNALEGFPVCIIPALGCPHTAQKCSNELLQSDQAFKAIRCTAGQLPWAVV